MAHTKADRPNILIVYPDQMRYDAMGCAGNPVVKTPHIDRLAHEGVMFEEAYVATPMCTPFRSSLHTGKYSHDTGAYSNHHPIDDGHTSMADQLTEIGYRTGYIGKWHLNGGEAPGFVPPGRRRLGFEHFVGFNRGHYYLDGIYFRDTEQPYHCPRFEPDYQTDQLLDFMESSIDDDSARPFFGLISYGPPHFPMDMPKHYKELYRPEEIVLGPTSGDIELQKKVTRELLDNGFPAASGVWGVGGAEAEFDDEQAVRRFMAHYYGLMANIDHNVGRIMAWLEKKGIADDTVVIFLSDHGDMAGEHGYRCGTKKTAFRQSMQVPLVVRYPKRFRAGTRVSSLVDVAVDTMPTIMELTDAELPRDVHGASYLPLLEGSPEPTREAVFYQVHRELEGPERFPIPERGVRTEEWLYVRTPTAPKLLIDLKNDPEELHNLVGDEQYRSQVDSLQAMLDEHMRRTGDDFSAEAIFPPAGFLSHEEKSEKQRQLAERAVVEC
ncbi:MAG: sulfatase [Trueperaceae bacterium]